MLPHLSKNAKKNWAGNRSVHYSIVEQMTQRTFYSSLTQIVRYGVVGVLNNSVEYLIYLLLTWRWLDLKVAVMLLYPISAFIGHYCNSKFVYSYSGSHQTGLISYVTAHVIGYVLNIFILFVFVDLLGYRHFVIQAIAIFAVAGFLFVLFRYYVFQQRALT